MFNSVLLLTGNFATSVFALQIIVIFRTFPSFHPGGEDIDLEVGLALGVTDVSTRDAGMALLTSMLMSTRT